MRRRVANMVVAVALGLATLFSFSGCMRDVPTDETGGLSSSAESTADANLVNPSQLPDSSFIYDASIADLDKADIYMDGETVQVTGEVVGDRIRSNLSDGNCWITLQATDESYAEISVFMTDAQSKIIDTFGSYGKRGTTLQVRGVFNLACKQHEGLTEIHATNVEIVQKGSISTPDFDPSRFVPGIVLVVVGLALFFLYRFLSEGRR